MSKKYYVAPLILDANGTINMTVSQLAAIGLETSVWNDFWDSLGDIVNECYPDFDINNDSTWPTGFDPNDSTTWDMLTEPPVTPEP